jgi:hypothetical protein
MAGADGDIRVVMFIRAVVMKRVERLYTRIAPKCRQSVENRFDAPVRSVYKLKRRFLKRNYQSPAVAFAAFLRSLSFSLDVPAPGLKPVILFLTGKQT